LTEILRSVPNLFCAERMESEGRRNSIDILPGEAKLEPHEPKATKHHPDSSSLDESERHIDTAGYD
jgi:hypothetical protein